jgi:hypothetical protein
MKKFLFPLLAFLFIAVGANAQVDSTKVIDNKGTIKYVLKANNPNIITRKDSLILYVTPKQLGDKLNDVVKYTDTVSMLMNYLNNANNGLTKSGQTVKLGGALSEPTTITTDAVNLLKIQGLQSGSSADSIMLVNPSDGSLKWISASSLFDALSFGNGLTKTGNNVELGGALTKPTTIATDATNTLKIAGLQSGSKTDSLVVIGADGTLKRITQESLLQSGEEIFTATSGQTGFTVSGTAVPLPEYSKVWVYRNGAKLLANDDYTVSGTTVTLVPDGDWDVAAGDKIEVQWVK